MENAARSSLLFDLGASCAPTDIEARQGPDIGEAVWGALAEERLWPAIGRVGASDSEPHVVA